MFYLPSTIISIIEVLLVIVPALLSVAYVTVAERKTMASMQRRLGPNQVGHISSTLTLHRNNLYVDYPFTNYINTFVVRRFHTSNYYLSNKNLLDSLLNSRLAPVIPFTHPVLITCDNFLNQTEKNEFFSKLSDLIIEINNSSKLIERENYYLCYYKPLLNTLFRSFYSADINKKIDLIDSVKDLKITENLSINIEEQTLINDTNYLEEDKENKDINQKPEKSIYPV